MFKPLIWLLRYLAHRLNPFGTGKVFKRIRDLVVSTKQSLNPFGTGKVFKPTACNGLQRLNPFGTGKVFKPDADADADADAVLIPSEQGKCSNKND